MESIKEIEMKLTGKCKEDFERWFLDKYGFDKWSDLKPCFYCLDNSLKYGSDRHLTHRKT